MKPIGIDPKKISFNKETGFLTMPTPSGYEIHMRLQPSIKIDENLGQNNEPAFFAQLNITESNITKLKNAITTQEELDKLITKLPFIPEGLKYKDFLVGFIYSNVPDPNNHQWFLQFRNDQDNIFDTLTVENQIDFACPTSTFSWFDQNWHGRLKVTPSDFKEVKEIKKGHIEIVGKKCGGYQKGDISLIPEGTEELVIRYNIFKNKWYLHFMKNEESISEIECDSILMDCKSTGFVNRNYPKPKVTQKIKPSDVANIQFLSNTLIIQGV